MAGPPVGQPGRGSGDRPPARRSRGGRCSPRARRRGVQEAQPPRGESAIGGVYFARLNFPAQPTR